MKNDPYILVVDDQMANIESLGESLADQYDVRFALSGQSALEMIAKSKPDLILLDIMMPDMNGYEVCRVLQSHPDTAQIPVIFITALATPEEETQGLDAGAVDYIVKPFNPSIVRARVRNHLALKYANDQLRVLSLTDSLTGLANRRHLFERLASEIEHLQTKPETEPFAIILIDIDYFKRYNDTYGHVAGDFCLQRVAGVIRSALRSPADLTARYGGEEFCCLLHQATLDEARQIAERISQSVTDLEIPHLGAYERQFVTVSAGVAQWQPHMAHIESVLQAADEALYAAKATGRNKVVCKV